jgi:hypothetical protein
MHMLWIVRQFTTCQRRSEYNHQTIAKLSILFLQWSKKNTYVHVMETFVNVGKLPVVRNILIDLDFTIKVIYRTTSELRMSTS